MYNSRHDHRAIDIALMAVCVWNICIALVVALIYVISTKWIKDAELHEHANNPLGFTTTETLEHFRYE